MKNLHDNDSPNVELDNNDDMIASETQIDYSDTANGSKNKGWTKQQIRSVFVSGIVITILIAVVTFLLKMYGIII